MAGTDAREVILARLEARAGEGEALAGLLREMAEDTWRSEPRTLDYGVYGDRERPEGFWVDGVFADRAALQPHLDRHEWRRGRFDAVLVRPAEFNFCAPACTRGGRE